MIKGFLVMTVVFFVNLIFLSVECLRQRKSVKR